MTRSLLVATSLAVMTSIQAGVARADGDVPDGSQPLAYSARPLTLPTLAISPQLDGLLDNLSTRTAAQIYTQNPKTLDLTTSLGASVGVFESIEVGAVVVPLQVFPEVVYGDPQVHATFRFVKGSFELAGYINTVFVTSDVMDPELMLPVVDKSASVLFQPGLFSRIHGGNHFKLDIGAIIPIQLGSNVSDLGLSVPIEIAFNLVDWFHLGATTGFGIVDFKDPALSSYLPLGFITGFAFGGDRPAVDLDALFRWPQFFAPGANDKIDSTDFQAGLSLKVYIYLK